MAAVSNGRGRGFALQIMQKQSMLRRPGQPAVETTAQIPKIPVSFDSLCERIVLLPPGDRGNSIANDIESICSGAEDLERFASSLLHCALRSESNAHAAAIFTNNHKDLRAAGQSQERLLTLVLRKLQGIYEGRSGPKWSNGQEEFQLEVVVMCEMFHHIRINDTCVKVLRPAVYDYFCMLLEGGATRDIDVFVQQFPKCYPDLKELNMELMLSKLRRNIVSQPAAEDRAKLLEVFERLLTEFRPLKEKALDLYRSVNPPAVCSNSP